jgi:hypothetical protein
MRRLFALGASTVVMALGGLFGAAAAQAEIYQFMNYTFLESGHNYFAPELYILTYVYGKSDGAAASCVGVSGHGYQVCGGEGEEVTTQYVGFSGVGYMHDHSTWNSYFTAYVQGEK